MNFNTTNSTFRQLMGNGLSYRVPMFQRDYSWGPDEWDDLWQDIVALFDEDPEPAHYMGYLVLQSADNRAFEIIDGQQRMTTLSLLMLAAVAHLTHLARSDDTYRLGNMTLLTAEANRDLGNSGYGQKRSVYQESSSAITRKLSEDFDTWTVEKIRTHQAWMAKQVPASGESVSSHQRCDSTAVSSLKHVASLSAPNNTIGAPTKGAPTIVPRI